MNFHTVFYDQIDEILESGYDTASPIQFTNFSNFLRTRGTGFSFSLGAIAKLNKLVRLGGSYQSPTWYHLNDDLSQEINSDLADDEISYINFSVINIFERYRIKTPAKFTGSLAMVFGKDGLLSFDYGYQDMSRAELRPTSDFSFATVNSEIANTLGSVSSFRVGGEYRIKQVSLRAGYRYEQSPYSDGNTIGDLYGYAGGIGFNFGGSRLDLAVNGTEQDYNLQLLDTGLPTAALINRRNTNVTLSYTMNF
jgi:long-subunit fatty acid transport protein